MHLCLDRLEILVAINAGLEHGSSSICCDCQSIPSLTDSLGIEFYHENVGHGGGRSPCLFCLMGPSCLFLQSKAVGKSFQKMRPQLPVCSFLAHHGF